MINLQKDIYTIRYENQNIVYSPLRRALFFADNESIEIIDRFITNQITEDDKKTLIWSYIKLLQSTDATSPTYNKINKKTHFVIIPTQICNFGCKYCYARIAHLDKTNMSYKLLNIVLNYILHSKSHKKSISFIGGGEPLTAWHIIKYAVEYLEQNKNGNDTLNIGITTNASLLTDEIIQYIKEHHIHVGVSFEIIPDIQNSQRPFLNNSKPSYDIINSNIQKLAKHNIPHSIRSTITKLNVKLMPEMVALVAKQYPQIKKLHLEQVTDPSEDDTEFYNDFIKYFYKAKDIGDQFGIVVYNSISKSIHTVKRCFCPGELCITPSGYIVACHRVSSENEKAFKNFRIGEVKNSVIFDQNSERVFFKHTYKKRVECEQCFAKWHCAGICPMERIELSESQIKAKCDFVKKIVTRELFYYLKNKLS